MNISCIKCSNLINNNGIKKSCVSFIFKKFKTMDKEELIDLLKSLNYIVIFLFEVWKEYRS